MKLRIEPSSGVSVTRQVADQIRAQFASGNLNPGDLLPSVRQLARELAVNQNTILRVYEKLTAEGLLERRHGAGTFVSADPPEGQLRQQRQTLRDEFSRLARRGLLLGVEPAEMHDMLDRSLAAITSKTAVTSKATIAEKQS
ncbi:MAG TPA: GntR family transcriptional regulator [Tepidisphaeraceae bacterium]|nr:GntR family transcriptional regulator [Tepidisphaeraceae bacterium]